MLAASSIYVINYWKPGSKLHAWNILTPACEPIHHRAGTFANAAQYIICNTLQEWEAVVIVGDLLLVSQVLIGKKLTR